MHVHSYFSDGSLTPEEIVEAAKKNNVGVLAVADHNFLEGCLLTRELCADNGIICIPAVEIDTLDGENHLHVLAYGFDVNNARFRDFLAHTRSILFETNDKLIKAMEKDYDTISAADYNDFIYDRRLGGWKSLHYLMAKGLTATLREGLIFYSRYNITHNKMNYSPVNAAVREIHQAGGYAVLAHPGEHNMINMNSLDIFQSEATRILEYGLDGIECYYPAHSEAITRICLDLCSEKDLLITAGSDCHGSFGKTRLGEMNIPVERLVLKDLLA
ncbi:MAG: PHP domain-containing protein [Defluviitaleaceae bacterium]|nr:PHP domain-containing protein [Defluviitaleaceae bacterium]MCL2836520.1 PHP domain-containing protein [Defluviitaleaceae bacterium]